MKKLLIKVVCLLSVIVFAIAMVGCAATEDTTSSLTTSESVVEETSSFVESEEESYTLEKQPSISEFDEQTEESAAAESEETEVQVVETETEVLEPVESTEPVESVEPVEVIESEPAEEEVYEEPQETYSGSPRLYEPSDFSWMGVLYWGGYRWTYYSQRVLPGEGLYIPGRHVDENGYVCDENDRICLASVDYEYGTVVPTPFGKEGCVYDSGCDSGTLDVYVDF